MTLLKQLRSIPVPSVVDVAHILKHFPLLSTWEEFFQVLNEAKEALGVDIDTTGMTIEQCRDLYVDMTKDKFGGDDPKAFNELSITETRKWIWVGAAALLYTARAGAGDDPLRDEISVLDTLPVLFNAVRGGKALFVRLSSEAELRKIVAVYEEEHAT